MPLVGKVDDWSETTQQGVIRDAILKASAHIGHDDTDCAVCGAVYTALLPGLGEAPLTFYRNGQNGREALPKGSLRARRFRYKIAEVHAYMSGEARVSVPYVAPAPSPKVEVKTDATAQAEATEMIRWIQQDWRPFCKARSADGKAFDEVGLRPAENASRMLTQGIPVKAIKHALTLHYPPEARRALGVETFDPTTFAPRSWGGAQAPSRALAHDGTHKALPYAVANALAGIPIAFVGPPGTGKTTLAKAVADALGRPFGFVSMTRGTSPSAFNGRPRISDPGTTALVQALIANGRAAEALELAEKAHAEGDVNESEFVRILKSGGGWLFDEMDASEPNLLLMVNAVLAQRKFANTATGETIHVSPLWVPMAAMNTLGLGGDKAMVGREKQDAAALDRWNAGRIEVQLDEALESHIFWRNVSAHEMALAA